MEFIQIIHKNILSVPFCIGLFILGATIVLELKHQSFLRRHIRRIFLYAAGLIFVYLIYIAYLQFTAFYEGGIMTPVLGTRQGIGWFLGYVQIHFWNDYLISLPAALIFALTGYFFNKKYAERFFEKEELWLAALGILLVGYPGFLFYLILVLLLPALASLLFVRRGERLPLYHFWIPTAIVVLLAVQFWAKHQSWWGAFRF